MSALVSSAAQSAAAFLQGKDHFLFLTHARPDGDTVGSAYALTMAMREAGKSAWMLDNPSAGELYAPYFTACCPEALPEELTVVSVDVADTALLPPEALPLAKKIVCVIDHHTVNHISCGTKCVEPTAAATAEIVREIIAAMGLPLSSFTAEGIYMGMMTDTGCFKYSNVRPQTLTYAADAVAAGANAAALARRHFIKKSAARMKLEATLISGFTYFADGRITVALLSRAEIEALGASEDDIGGMASLTVVPEKCEIGIFCRETEDGSVKASVRTDLHADAALLCAKFGGGGHVRAAGCTLKGFTLAEAADALRKEAEKLLVC